MSGVDKKDTGEIGGVDENTDTQRPFIMDPYEIWRYNKVLEASSQADPDGCKRALEILVNKFPIIAYIYHMDQSGHSFAFIDLVKELIDKKGLKIEMPFADIGCGPGNMMWWFLRKGLMPPGDIAMVDIRSDYIDYARELLVEREKQTPFGDPARNNFHFLNIDIEDFSKKSAEEGMKFNTVYSSLVLQWVGEDLSPEDTQKKLKLVCQSIFDSMNSGGKFIFIGEHPKNVTATTPVSFAQGGFKKEAFDIGYNKGCSWEDVRDACIGVGFQAEGEPVKHIMGLAKSPDEVKKAQKCFMEEIAKLETEDKIDFEKIRKAVELNLIIQNHHHALATIFRKP
jgi:SAM-dependent methyltransferase